uniref:alpha-1,6-mannosyl-glycoprotein 6-beta-N-acetylglucosaminyltransferase n=1 Tax=Neogobius melanostomus TaxID=47308 RepID=A0A8C6TBK7_9GOBI
GSGILGQTLLFKDVLTLMLHFQFLQLHWKTDPCYSFYGVDGTTCSLLKYLSQTEDFAPLRRGTTSLPTMASETTSAHTEEGTAHSKAIISFDTVCNQMSVVLRPKSRFEAMVERGGPLGELVQWADLGASLTILGHNVTLTTSQHLLHRLVCGFSNSKITSTHRPVTSIPGEPCSPFRCRFRILDSFGTEPAFNLGTYARSREYKTLWGSWDLHPQQFMTMFPHTPDNSFLGFVSEEAMNADVKKEATDSYEKGNVAVVYAKQEYMWEVCTKVAFSLVPFMCVHTLVLPSQLFCFNRSNSFLFQVFVGLGFPYEGPAPIEAIAMGCAFLQPRFNPPHSSKNNNFYRGKPTTRKISSQHPYAEEFIGKPHVWTVDINNSTEIRQAVKDILHAQVQPFTPREFTCEGMLERLQAYITHQCPEDAVESSGCVVRRRVPALLSRCEPALFHHINSALNCSSVEPDVSHLFPAYSPWGRQCHLQQEPFLFSCAGSDPSFRRLCACRAFLPGQVALCPDCQ